ncbi:MAG TPA: PAS domain S-box protein [Coleofasciculaceae cyanobacterium]
MCRPIRLLRYGMAIGSVALALVLTLLLQSLLAPSVLLLFVLAVVFSTWYGGRGAGFTATVLAVLASRYFLLSPVHSFFPIPGATIAALIVFSLVTLLISLLETDLRLIHRRSRRHLLDLEQTEVALRKSDARFRAAAEGSFDAIYILKSVRDKAGELIDFQFVDLNEHGAKLISLKKENILGQNLCDLLPVNRTQGFFEKYKQVVETGIPLVEEFPSQGTPGVTASWLHHQVMPFEDGVTITTRDITERKQAEAALQASELLYRTLAEAMPQLVWTQNAEGKVDYANRQWQQALGVTLDEVDRLGWAHLVHPEDLPKLQVKESVSIQEGEVREAEFRYRMADGSYRWFLGRCVPVKDDRGQIVKWVGTSTDIDDLKRYERELVRRKRRFKTLADNSPDIISRLDRNLRHVYVNPAITKATGLSPQAFVGKTHDDLNIPDHLRSHWQEQLRRVFTTGQPCSYEFEFPAPDRTRYYLARMVPEFAPDGTVESILGITSDITEFRQVEQALRESEWRFRRVMESNMIGMGFWTFAGEITEANDALLNLLGYTRDEFLAEKPRWRDLTPPEYAEIDEQAVEQIRQTGVCTPFEKEYLRKDGSRVSVLCGGATFEKTAEHGVFFLLDLSDRKQMEKERDRLLQLERAARAEAEAANRIKDEFLLVLSHELRTPLNPILGWTKLLKTRQFAPGIVTQALDTIERNAQQQAQLVEDLLDVSRILQGKLTLNCCPVNLVEVIQGAIASMQFSAQAKAIAIEAHLDTTVPPVLGNQERLQQVVWNLLSNAVKFTPNNGRVDVYLTPVGKYAQIQVTDTGRGIEASFLPFVFDYFRQADGSTTRSFSGLGLGLAISRHLVELHGGMIEAASEGLGKGAIFTVRLLIPSEEPALLPDCPTPTPPQEVLNEKRILLAGVKDDTRDLIAVMLEQAGAVVVSVTSTNAVLEELARSQPDILIGAIAMLRENNYELTERLRLWSQEFGEETPVVALLSYPHELDPQEALKNGLQHVLLESMEPDQLITAIARLIFKSELR